VNEQQKDFQKIIKMIGHCIPTQLGSLMRQYSHRYLNGGVEVNPYKDVNKVFDGGLGLDESVAR
jgi:hypothetical protein